MSLIKEVTLTNNEKKILLTVSRKSKFTPEELASPSSLPIEAAMQSAFLLAEKGLCEVKETITTIYNLTKEGETYANISLPERQIISSLTAPISLDELKKKFPPQMVGIALGWLRKKNWVRIEGDKIIPSGKADPGEDENIIEKLKLGTPSEPGEAVKDLIKRNLVEKTDKKSRIITITGSGKTLVATGLTIEEEIAQLTPTIITSGSWKTARIRPYNIHTPVKPVYGAKIHPYQRLINAMRQIFLEMGCTEIKGDVVQSSFWNFDALYQPQDHPAREMQDTFHLATEHDLAEEYITPVKEMHETGGGISRGWGGKWSEDVSRKQGLRKKTT